jgi:V/A-type H+-transporting ATPase subunit D
MSTVFGIPPGRAGRIWLRDRLATARRAADLLDRKLRALRAEQETARQRERDAEADWTRSYQDADRWLLRAVLLGGERQLRLDAGGPSAQLNLHWISTVGAVHPVEVDCRPAPWPEDGAVPGTAALVEAAAAYRDAVRAAAVHAAAVATRAALDREASLTRRRLRAVSDRRVPALERALRERGTALAESERAELVRLRWATGRVRSDTGVA